MQKILSIITLVLLAISVHANEMKVYSNEFGDFKVNHSDIHSNSITFSNNNGSIKISSKYDNSEGSFVEWEFPDGSYIRLFKSFVKRYSTYSNEYDTLGFDKPHTLWNVSTETWALFQQMNSTTNTVNLSKGISNSVSYDTSYFTDNRSNKNNICHNEWEDYTFRGYGGFPTFERCTRTANYANVVAAIAVSLGCFIPQPFEPATCALAVASFGGAALAHSDSRFLCSSTHSQASRNYWRCERSIKTKICNSGQIDAGDLFWELVYDASAGLHTVHEIQSLMIGGCLDTDNASAMRMIAVDPLQRLQ